MLAVTDNFICYTVRRQLLRVIHTVTSERALLRGHEHTVVDMKFSVCPSPQGGALLCSVDDGAEGATSQAAHVCVWKLDDTPSSAAGGNSSKEITNTRVCSLSVCASIVQPHPLQSHLWAIAHTNHRAHTAYIALFSADAHAQQTTAYEQFPMHAVCAGTSVTDLAVSVDGHYLIASLCEGSNVSNSHVCVWKINNPPPARAGAYYPQSSLSVCFKLPTPECVCVRGLAVGLVCVSQRPQQQGPVELTVQVCVFCVECFCF